MPPAWPAYRRRRGIDHRYLRFIRWREAASARPDVLRLGAAGAAWPDNVTRQGHNRACVRTWDGSVKLLNTGIYPPVEVARLLRLHPELVTRWTRDQRRSIKGAHVREPAIVRPSHGDLLSFLDLVSLMVVKELHERFVPTEAIRAGGLLLASQFDTQYPFAHRGAHQKIATAGRSFFATVAEGPWVDAGHGGQGVFEEVIAPMLEPLDYDSEQLAALWRPHDRVWINPRVQAGSPCVDRRRVPTGLLVQLVENGDDCDEIAGAYELDRADVDAAVEWERSLAA